jgi:hypothetical protein
MGSLEGKGVSCWNEDVYALEKLVAQVRAEYVRAGMHDLNFLDFQACHTFRDRQTWLGR